MKELFVMIIEDEHWARESLRRLCEMIPGVKVVGAFEDGIPALAFARKKHFDAVIIDVLLPNSSGFEIGKTLKSELPELNLVYTSAVDEYEKHIQEYGGNAFLQKPIELKRLRRALEMTD